MNMGSCSNCGFDSIVYLAYTFTGVNAAHTIDDLMETEVAGVRSVHG